MNTSFTKLTAAHIGKDMRLEWRSRDVFNSMLFFSILVVVIFSFAFEPTAEESRRLVGGLFWVAFLFSTIVALNQSWARELRNGVLDAYRVSPAAQEALFFGKCIGNFVFVAILECLMTPLLVLFYNLSSVGAAWQLVLILLLGTWALVINGTFFCRHVHPHPQPRVDAAVTALACFDSRSHGNGERHNCGINRRVFPDDPHQAFSRVLRSVYCCQLRAL